MPDASDDFIRNMLRKGKKPEWVADASGWSLSAVRDVARQLASTRSVDVAAAETESSSAASAVRGTATQTLTRLREDARAVVEPAAEFKARATSATELLVRADSIQDRRIQSALGRARKAMIDLAGLMNVYDEKAQLRARVAHLEEQLAAAKSELRGPKQSQVETQGGGLSDAAAPAVLDNKAIRSWASRNNVECPAVGRVPRTVVDAWKAAHAQPGSAE